MDDSFHKDFLLTYRTFLDSAQPVLSKLKEAWECAMPDLRDRVSGVWLRLPSTSSSSLILPPLTHCIYSHVLYVCMHAHVYNIYVCIYMYVYRIYCTSIYMYMLIYTHMLHMYLYSINMILHINFVWHRVFLKVQCTCISLLCIIILL